MFGVQPGMIVADLGAGSGHYTFEFARQLGGSGRVYAVDVQQDLLRRIKNEAAVRGLRGVEVIHGDVERMHGTKLAERAVDLALLSNVLFQLEDPQTALKEAWRILRPVGVLVVIEWSDAPPVGGWRLGPTKKHVIGKERARSLAHNAGFDLAREFDAGAHHFGLVLKPMRFNQL